MPALLALVFAVSALAAPGARADGPASPPPVTFVPVQADFSKSIFQPIFQSGNCLDGIVSPLAPSQLDLTRYVRYLIMTAGPGHDTSPVLSDGAAQASAPNASAPSGASSDYVPGDGSLPPSEDAGVSLSELFKSNPSRPAPVTVISATKSFDDVLETLGLGRVAVRNMADVWGIADINTMQITAKGTADVHVFKAKLGRNATLIGLAGVRVYLEREADFCVTCSGSWDAEAFSVGGGLALVVPGPFKGSPVTISVGAGPTLMWGYDAEAPNGNPSAPALSGTVLGKAELVTF